MLISTPRTDSRHRRPARTAWPQYREEHLTYFSLAGLVGRAAAVRPGRRDGLRHPQGRDARLRVRPGRRLPAPGRHPGRQGAVAGATARSHRSPPAVVRRDDGRGRAPGSGAARRHDPAAGTDRCRSRCWPVASAPGSGTAPVPTVPKALVVVAGRPFIDLKLDELRAGRRDARSSCSSGTVGRRSSSTSATAIASASEIEFIHDPPQLLGTGGRHPATPCPTWDRPSS